MNTARPPDYDITAFDKDRQTGAKVGAAWNQEDGSISLVLNPGTALVYGSNMVYKVKPRLPDGPAQVPRPTSQTKVTRRVFQQPHRSDLDDDIPF